LELGNDFAFVGRPRRRRIGHEWFRVDLLRFHRQRRCLVIIDLKIGVLVHSDIGQINLYCNYARANWTQPDELPPVGLILAHNRMKRWRVMRWTLAQLNARSGISHRASPVLELASEVNRASEVLVRPVAARRLARRK